MKKILMSMLIGLSFVFNACGGDDKDEPVPPVVKQPQRTVLAYIVADNSLSSFAYDDVDEMLQGMKSIDTDINNLLVYVDDNATPVLFRLKKGKDGLVEKEILREYEEQQSTNPQVMKEVCRKAYTDYPAKSYGLIYWSHGEGWKPMPLTSSTRWIGQDKSGGETDYTNIDELKEVLTIVPHLDFLLFDACFMMSVETAYALRDEADYIIASPTEIPGPGAPYDTMVPAMFKQGNTAVDIAKAYYNTYETLYNDGKGNSDSHWTAGVSIGVLKTSALSALAQATGNALSNAIDKELSALKGEIFDYDQRPQSSSSRIGYYDMAQIIQSLTTGTDWTNWEKAYGDAMVYYQTTPKNFSSYSGMFSMEGTCGLSHYLPTGNTSLNTAYAQTEWYTAASLASWGW